MNQSLVKLKLIVIGLLFSTVVLAQEQKTQEFTVERIIPVSAERVWKVVGLEFADIAKSHPKLADSHYVEGTPMTGEGCERICTFSEDGEKYTKEKIVNFDPENYSFRAEINGIAGLPLETDISYVIYDVDPISENSCKLSLKMVYRTNPAVMGVLAKGRFKKNLTDYTIAIEHHVKTGEDVNPETFKQIRKQYL
ncbi:SRPBCC family protein [Sediminitomix flava]|uniref:Polyketide cyclase/dehydrase/lipid transport protein n=1 Tax=Sediminitomix flava TaxID=379075 RepID=A0A315Z5I3_SEDFL|nr:SRPBCC family protein [Sediminitomix flava]PWJ39168.1 polyketide cyclase/dehydrase/lipid transport protein [Sediminitomix flava]